MTDKVSISVDALKKIRSLLANPWIADDEERADALIELIDYLLKGEYHQ